MNEIIYISGCVLGMYIGAAWMFGNFIAAYDSDGKGNAFDRFQITIAWPWYVGRVLDAIKEVQQE